MTSCKHDHIRVTNNLDPDQAKHFVGPDLGPKHLQTLNILADHAIKLTNKSFAEYT